MEILVFFLLVGLVSGAPGALDLGRDNRILNGSVADEGQFPYLATIVVDGNTMCGGFIYNYNYVVTAASCVYKKLVTAVKVTVGLTSQISPGPAKVTYNVTNITYPPAYNPTTNPGLNNIATLKIADPGMSFDSKNVDLILYDEVNSAFPDVTIMGWGATTDGGIVSPKLRYANFTIAADSTCTNYYSTFYDKNYMICASSTYSTACTNDTGSPAVQNGRAVGIVIRNLNCASPPLPFVLLRLSSYFSFLNNNAGSQMTTTTVPTTPPYTGPTAPCEGCVTPSTPPPAKFL